MKKFILLLVITLLSCSTIVASAQSRSHTSASQSSNQGTYRVYAILKVISKGRMALDFGQKAEGGLFYGQISDILLDSEGNDYKIESDHAYMKLLNNLSRLGWFPTGGMGVGIGEKIFTIDVVLYKDVRNDQEIIEGLRFKQP